jgi:hypothetical protein
MTSNTAPYVRVKNVGHYIDSQRERSNAYCIIKPSGEYFYLCNGNEIPGNEWEANNPLPELQKNEIHKGFRLDSRTNWID